MDYNRGPRNKSTQLQASNLDKVLKACTEKRTASQLMVLEKIWFYLLTNEGRYVPIILHKSQLEMEQNL